MTDRKISSSSRATQASEPLYEREDLSDSDGAFLAELNLVLTADEQGEMSPVDPAKLTRKGRFDNALESLGLVQTADAADLERQDEAKLELNSGIINAHKDESASAGIGVVDSGKVQAPLDEAIKRAWIDGFAPWLGAVTLMGIIAVGMGGAGLWRVVEIEDRLNRIESVSRITAAPVVNTTNVENSRRIGDLERRLGSGMERVQADLEALEASLAKELERRNERLDEDLAALNATLYALQEQLRSAQALMAETDTMGRRPSNTPIVPGASSAQPAPDPGPPVDGSVASDASASSPGEKTSQWSVNLFAADRQDKTEEELARFRAQDVPAEVLSVVNKGKVWYRIAVRGFDSFEKASVYAETLRSKPGLSGVWVGRN